MPKVVALHGFTGCSQDFDPLKAALNPTFELIAPDFPGHGSRKNQIEAETYSLATHEKIISEAVGSSDKIILLGYSMGGRLALHWALNHPEKIARLILISASPGLADAVERVERQRGDEALAEFIRRQGVAPFIKYWNGKTFFRPLMNLPAERLNPILERRLQNSREGLALSLENVGTAVLPSHWTRLHELRGPVDLVVGEHDPKFVEVAHRMGERIPKARISVIEGAGHVVHLEYPQDCAKLIEN